jgi:hypothetical protein
MTLDLLNMPPGDYSLAYITSIAEEVFPDGFAALIDYEELAWADVDSPGFLEKGLVLGWLKVDHDLHQVLACMTANGDVRFFTRSGLALNRTDGRKVRMAEPWVFARDTGKRPGEAKIRALCQYYFLAADLAVTAKVDKPNWFVTFKVACKLVGDVMGLLEEDGDSEVEGEEEEEVGEGGEGGVREEGLAPVSCVDAARVVQELLEVVVRDAEEKEDEARKEWVAEKKEDLEEAWPALMSL